MTVGLHVTVSSLLKHICEGVHPRIYLVTDGLDDRDVDLLRQTASMSNKPHDLIVSTFTPPETLRGLPKLRDSYLTYARLFAHENVRDARIVYLDSDLLVKRDMSELHALDLGGFVLGGRVNGQADGFLDRDFLCRVMDFEPTMPTFNAGVLIVDLEKWRQQDFDAKVNEMLLRYGSHLKAHDQSVLNALAAGDFCQLHACWNVHAKMPRPLAAKCLEGQVWHFMGAPKPWEYMAALANGYTKPYFEAVDQTALAGWRPTFRWHEVRRSAKNYRYFARHLSNHVKLLKPSKSQSTKD